MRFISGRTTVISIILLVLSACATDGTSSQKTAQTTSELGASPAIVRIAVSAESYPPFSFKDASGRWTGFDMDLAQAVCAAERLRCEMIGIPWAHLLPQLLERRVDAVWSSMQITEERKKIIAFTEIYYESINALVGRTGDAAAPSVADSGSLAGKVIGVQGATASAAFIHKRFGTTAEVKFYSTLDGALADLKAGRLDYVSDFVAFLTPFLDANPGFAIKTAWPLDPILNQGVAIAIRQDDTVLRDKLNSGLAAVISSGTYDQILGRYPGLDREIRKPQF